MYCKRCKKENSNNNTYCIYCGKKLKITKPTINKSVIYKILLVLLILGISITCFYYMNVKEYKIYTDTEENINIKINEGIIQKGVTTLRNDYQFEPINRMGVIYNKNNKPQHYLVLARGVGDYEGTIFETSYMTYSIDIKTGEPKAGIHTDFIEKGADTILEEAAKKIIEGGESFAIFNFKSKLGTFIFSKEEDTHNNNVQTAMNYEYPTDNNKKEITPGLTGIEQAIKDGQIGDDYISQGVSEEWLHFAYSDGNLRQYYDSWEQCLQDAKDLGILREPTQEELNALNSGI